MHWILRYDRWFESWVRAVLSWLEEWFGLAQKTVERALIVIYLVLAFYPVSRNHIGDVICTMTFVTLVMVTQHRRPAAIRGLHHFARILRVVVIVPILLLMALILTLPMVKARNSPGMGLAQLVYLVFFYMTDISNHNERGRRRGLALAKLKELFGDVSWLPKPVEVEG